MNRLIPLKLIVGGFGLSLLAGCGSGLLFRDPAVVVRDPGRIIGRPRIEKHVVRIVSLWEPTTGTGIDGKTARGFAGQILFFGPHGETGARVRGKVNIYEYDQYDPESDQDLTPLHTFSFDADAWEVHRREGTFGHSYSCFIPYVQKHKEQVNCGLKVEFIPEEGPPIEAEITEVLLTSRTSAAIAANKTRGFVRESQMGGKVTQAAAFRTGAPATQQKKMESLTIPMPKR